MLEPGEVMYGEAIIYDQAARIVRGEPLYQPPDRPPYTVAAYTPLFYWLAAGLQATVSDGFWPGRALSVVAGLVVAGLVAYLAASRAGDRRAGAFAALLFLALGLPGIPPWSALYKQDIVGVALSVGAIAILAAGRTTYHRVLFAGALAGLAVLTKQTFVAAGLAGVAWLWRRGRSWALAFTGVALAVGLVVCAVYELTTGAFLSNTVSANVNPFRLSALVSNLMSLLAFQAGPLMIAGLYAADKFRKGPTEEEKLLIYFWLASMVPLVGLAKVGSNLNYWIELAAITAVLATLGIWARLHEARESARRALMPLLLLGITLVGAAPLIGGAAIIGLNFPGPDPIRAQEFNRLVERVRSEPREVLANPLDVVALSGRSTVLEPYLFNILGTEGRWDDGPLLRRICAGDIGLLVLDHPLDGDGPAYHGYAHWPSSILAALREIAVLEGHTVGRFVYSLDARTGGEICPVVLHQTEGDSR